MTAAVMGIRSKVVVITGAARGIWQQFARSLAATGLPSSPPTSTIAPQRSIS
jgi:hypothetical protein